MDHDGDRDHDDDPVTVFRTSDVDLVPVIKSLLQSADIPFAVEGEGLMNLLPSNALGPAFSGSAGQLRFKVPADLETEARAVLEEAPAAGELPAGDRYDDEDGNDGW